MLPFNIVFQSTVLNCFNTCTIKGLSFHSFPRDDKTVKVCTYFTSIHFKTTYVKPKKNIQGGVTLSPLLILAVAKGGDLR